jgi:DNA-binding NarL/FixJ family response regulator
MKNNNQLFLIVDDSELIRENIKKLLEGSVRIKRILTSGTYEEAIRLINSEQPDVVLLDINLPFFKNGIDVLRYTKQYFPAIKIIMFTNQASEYHRELCLKLGASHFIDKSKDFEALPGIVNSIN